MDTIPSSGVALCSRTPWVTLSDLFQQAQCPCEACTALLTTAARMLSLPTGSPASMEQIQEFACAVLQAERRDVRWRALTSAPRIAFRIDGLQLRQQPK